MFFSQIECLLPKPGIGKIPTGRYDPIQLKLYTLAIQSNIVLISLLLDSIQYDFYSTHADPWQKQFILKIRSSTLRSIFRKLSVK